MRSPDFRSFMSRILCVRPTFVRSTEFRAFNRLFCVHVQTSVLSSEYWRFHDQTFVCSPDFRAFMSRLLRMHTIFVPSTDFRAIRSRLSFVQQILMRSCPTLRALNSLLRVHIRLSCVHQIIHAFISRLLCVHQTFECSCPDLRLFTSFMRSCPDFSAFTRLFVFS